MSARMPYKKKVLVRAAVEFMTEVEVYIEPYHYSEEEAQNEIELKLNNPHELKNALYEAEGLHVEIQNVKMFG